MLYKVFVDDSGKKEYLSPYSKEFIDNPPDAESYLQFWRDNYFVLCGVKIAIGDIAVINGAINALKQKYFNTHKVEIKSDWLRNPKQRNKYYMSGFEITEPMLLEFTNELYELIAAYKGKMKFVAIVFDKRFYGHAKRKMPDGTPLVKCTQVLFERLQYLEDECVVIFDQMEDHLKINKGDHKKILKISQTGGDFENVYVKRFNKIIDVEFKKSSIENFIQIADVCAYNIFRQFVEYGRQWQTKDAQTMSMYPYFYKIRCNFQTHPVTGKVVGIGLSCIPNIGRCNWNLLEGCEL